MDNAAPWPVHGQNVDGLLDGLPNLAHPPSLVNTHRLSDFSANSDLDDDNGSVPVSQQLHSSPIKASANSAGGLPDFLSDSALGVADVCARASSGNAAAACALPDDILPVPCDILTNGFSNHGAAATDDDDTRDALLHRLQEENQHLRRSLREVQERAQHEAARATNAVHQMELSQRHEAEETAALEKMMQQVEANLETATLLMTALRPTAGRMKIHSVSSGSFRHHPLVETRAIMGPETLQRRTLPATCQILFRITRAVAQIIARQLRRHLFRTLRWTATI